MERDQIRPHADEHTGWSGHLNDRVRAVLAAGLAWLYDTTQPAGAIPDHHGYTARVGDRIYRFIGQGARNLPVVVVDVADPRYDKSSDDWPLLNPLGGPAEMDAVAAAIEDLGHRVADRWNGQATHETGSLGLARPTHPSLRAALRLYRKGCPDHPVRSVFCPCGWLQAGRALVVLPSWPAEGAYR